MTMMGDGSSDLKKKAELKVRPCPARPQLPVCHRSRNNGLHQSASICVSGRQPTRCRCSRCKCQIRPSALHRAVGSCMLPVPDRLQLRCLPPTGEAPNQGQALRRRLPAGPPPPSIQSRLQFLTARPMPPQLAHSPHCNRCADTTGGPTAVGGGGAAHDLQRTQPAARAPGLTARRLQPAEPPPAAQRNARPTACGSPIIRR